MPRRAAATDANEPAETIRPRKQHLYELMIENTPQPEPQAAPPTSTVYPQSLEQLRALRERRTLSQLFDRESELELLKQQKAIEDEKALGLIPQQHEQQQQQPQEQQPQVVGDHFLTVQDAMEYTNLPENQQQQKVMQAYQTLMPIYAMRNGGSAGEPRGDATDADGLPIEGPPTLAPQRWSSS